MAARNAYNVFSLSTEFSGPRIMSPKNNYIMGTTLSPEYRGPAWYVPSERRWERFNEHCALPLINKPDSFQFVRESEYIYFTNKRDRYRAPLIQSYLPTKIPDYQWRGHKRDINTIPPIPGTRVGRGNYNYFYELLDQHTAGEFCKIPYFRK